MDEFDDGELMRRQAASLMGQARTEKKAVAARENGKRGGRPVGTGRPLSDETKERMRVAYRARLERETQLKIDALKKQLEQNNELLEQYTESSDRDTSK